MYVPAAGAASTHARPGIGAYTPYPVTFTIDAVQVVEFRINRTPIFPVPESHVPESEPEAKRKTEPPRVVTATPTIVVHPTPPVDPMKNPVGTGPKEGAAQGAFGAIFPRLTAPGAMIGLG